MTLQHDIDQLKKNPTPEIKRQIAEKISYYLDCNVFDEKEKKIALDVVELMIRDVDKQIRQTIANNLKEYPELPNSIATTLAEDLEDDVAIPIIEFSEVLSEGDVLKILDSAKKADRITAVSKRKNITDKISSKIIDKDIDEATKTLLSNRTAKISKENMTKVIDKYSDSEDVLKLVVDRGGLPSSIIEKIVTVVSDDLKQRLIHEYKLPPNIANDIAIQSQEQAMASKFQINANREQTVELIERLCLSKKLTPSLVLRALCRGDVLFFALALGKLAKIPQQFAENMVLKEGATSLASLYRKADMPRGTLEAVNIILRLAVSILQTEPNIDQNAFSDSLYKKIIENGYDVKINMMSYFMTLIKTTEKT